jgi:hypothetical protein
VAILDGDILKAKGAEEITGLTVTGTIIGGKVVYDASTSTAPTARAGATKVAAYRHQASAACRTRGVVCCCQANERRLTGTRTPL